MSAKVHALASPSSASRHKWRRFWLKLHLYFGLSFGLIFLVSGLTGSLLVFYNEIDELINPELQVVESAITTPKPYEAIFQALQTKHPDRSKAWRFEIPRNQQAMVMARYYKPLETEHLHFAPFIAWVNPYTAEVVSSRLWGQYLMTWLYDLHYTLLLDLTGKTIMACFGGVILVSLGTGIYLWWPAAGKLKTALTFKRHASAERFNFDLHKVNGIYGLVFTLLLVISGILLELPDFFNPGINWFSPLYQAQTYQSKNQIAAARITVDQAVASAAKQFPNTKLRWIETPVDRNGSYRIQFYQSGEPSERFPKSTVWIDQYSGQVLAIRNPEDNSAGDTLISWLHPLHSGEIAGMTGRWLVFVMGFVPAVLFVTGFIRWLQKRKAQQFKRSKSH